MMYEALIMHLRECAKVDPSENTFKEAADAIEELQKQRKAGKWRENGEPNAYGKFELWYYDCSLCGAVGIQEYNYCPNCGARMVMEDV